MVLGSGNHGSLGFSLECVPLGLCHLWHMQVEGCVDVWLVFCSGEVRNDLFMSSITLFRVDSISVILFYFNVSINNGFKSFSFILILL